MPASKQDKERQRELGKTLNSDGNGSEAKALRTKKARIDVSPSSVDAETSVKTLLGMPDEILVMIVGKLPFHEVVQLRRLCRKFRDMFSTSFCKDPVVEYNGATKDGDLEHLLEIISSIAFESTRTLTISQRQHYRDEFIIDYTVVQDLKARCPWLKRLILKSSCSCKLVRLKASVVARIPDSVELELHRAVLVDYGATTIQLHGIFRGPFSNWTVKYVQSHLQDPGFYRPMGGGFDSDEESDEDDEEDEEDEEDDEEEDEEDEGDEEDEDSDSDDGRPWLTRERYCAREDDMVQNYHWDDLHGDHVDDRCDCADPPICPPAP